MKREEKNLLSRQRILDAALGEFSARGYEGASLNTVWAENGLSKGVVYHHFRDRDEIYICCVALCFDALTAELTTAAAGLTGTAEERLGGYFDVRLRFFARNGAYLGIFSDACFRPPQALRPEIARCRAGFDALNIAVLTELLNSRPLRPGLAVDDIVGDFRLYMDYFNLRFGAAPPGGLSPEDALRQHEESCRRQLDILLHGVLGGKDDK